MSEWDASHVMSDSYIQVSVSQTEETVVLYSQHHNKLNYVCSIWPQCMHIKYRTKSGAVCCGESQTLLGGR